MKKSCKITNKKFEITEKDLEFYEKMGVPVPTLCPEERQRRRLAWQNMSSLYHRECDATWKKLISNYSADKIFPVYEKNYWFWNENNTLDYWMDFDFEKSFFEQFKHLQNKVPRFSIQQQEPMENSQYCNFASNCKNCYLIFDSDFCENCLYSNVLKNSENTLDCTYCYDMQNSYFSKNCENGYKLFFSSNSINCSESYFLKNCTNCNFCFGCVGLENQKYNIFNKQYSKQDYLEKIESFKLWKNSRITEMQKFFKEHIKKFPEKKLEWRQNENVSWNYIYHSKNITESYHIKDCEDVSYSSSIWKAKNCMDTTSFWENIENIYEWSTIWLNSSNIMFCFTAVLNSNNLLYCDTAYSSNNCFGCIWIQNEEYCILNKQYSKEEYQKMLPKIISHMKKTWEWWEFFSINNSPFWYNETLAQDFFPLSKSEILKKWYSYKEEEKSGIYNWEKYIIPDDIIDLEKEILTKILSCNKCEKNYKLTELEYNFYKKNNLPVPRNCPNCRKLERI